MNTNQQTVHQLGFGINEMVKQATGRESVSSIDMDWVSVEQLARYIYGSGSGDVVSFDTNIPDAIESLIAYITALQDLNGYDNPWPAGGGKNILVYPYVDSTKTTKDVTFTVNNDGSITMSGTATDAAYFNFGTASANTFTLQAGTYLVHNTGKDGVYFAVKNVSGTTLATAGQNTPVSFTLIEQTDVYAYYSVLSGTNTNGTYYPMIESGSIKTAWQPYSNLCPITGWTGVNVTRTGKNLYNPSETEQNKWVSDSGIQNATGYWLSGYILLKAGKTYYRPQTGSGRNAYFDLSKNFVSYFLASDQTLTPAADCYIRFTGVESSYPAAGDIQLEIGTAASDYEEYQGETYSFTFPDEAGTVYGGTLDVLSGVLTVDKAILTLGAADQVRNTSIEGTGKYVRYEAANCKIDENSICVIGEALKGIKSSSTTPRSAWECNTQRGTGATYIVVFVPSDATTSTVDDAIKDTKVLYDLATPVSYQLTAQEVEALVGQINNIFADTGNVSVEYKVKEDLV